jgi:hypothetical protein
VRIHTSSTTADTRVPWLGEDTDAVLQAELGLSPDEVEGLRVDGIVA